MPNLSRLTCSLFTSQIHILFTFYSRLLNQQKTENNKWIERQQTEAEDRRRSTLKHCVRFFLASSVPSYHLPPRRAAFPRGASWWQLPLRRGRRLWRPSGDGASNNTAGLNEKGNRGEKTERRWEERVESAGAQLEDQNDLVRLRNRSCCV